MKPVILAIVLASFGSPLFAQTLTEAQITEALSDTKADTFQTVGVNAGPFRVILAGPMVRVNAALREAARALKPFTRADVTDEMIGPFLRVSAWPSKPSYSKYGGWSVTPAATNIVLLPKGSTDLTKAVQPTSKEAFPQEWGNALGAKFEGQGMTADFNLSDVPPGEFDVVIGCECPRPMRGTVKLKDRPKIR